MINVRKNREILRLAMVTSALVGIGFAGLACNRRGSESSSCTGGAEAKMAREKTSEAEPLYEGREDMNKARLAVSPLRQAHAADYSNYEAAWNLSRAA